MNPIRPITAALALAAGLLAAAPAHAASGTDNCTGFIDSLPATISTQGIWCLRTNLVVNQSANMAITLAANNVTLDCNGFGLRNDYGNHSVATGIGADGASNLTVRDCRVEGFYYGIRLVSGSGQLVEDSVLLGNWLYGIEITGTNNLVRRNRVMQTGGYHGSASATGIRAFADVIDNTVDGITASGSDLVLYGILAYGKGNAVRGNIVRIPVVGDITSARAINLGDSGMVASGNAVSASGPVTGEGVIGTQPASCLDNVSVNFSNNFSCAAVLGNLPSP